MPLKPLDLMVGLSLTLRKEPVWTYAELGEQLGLSASEANKAVERCLQAGLLSPGASEGAKPTPVRAALMEFLAHGVRYAFSARPGRQVRGTPTAHSAPPLSDRIRAGDEPAYVWPDPEGTHRGQAIEPLYSSAPGAARRSPALHELLALTDAIRCGRSRERALAIEELHKRLIESP